MKHSIIFVPPLLIVAVAGRALADSGEGFGHIMWGGGSGFFGGLMMLLFWIFVIGLVVLAMRGLTDRSGTGPEKNAMDILRERFAKGEIEEEDFDRMKAKLDNE